MRFYDKEKNMGYLIVFAIGLLLGGFAVALVVGAAHDGELE